MPAVLNNLDMNDQYGAVPKTSPTFALIDMLHDWSTKGIHGMGATTRTILFDYRKAFG